jgi:hypothetical protein
MAFPIPTSEEYALMQYKGDMFRPINNYLNKTYFYKNGHQDPILDKYIEYIDNAMKPINKQSITGVINSTTGNLVVYRGMPNIEQKFVTGKHFEKGYWSTSLSFDSAYEMYGRKYDSLLCIRVPDNLKVYNYSNINFEKEILLQRDVMYTILEKREVKDNSSSNNTPITLYEVSASPIDDVENNIFYNITPQGISNYENKQKLNSEQRVKKNISNALRHKSGGKSKNRTIKRKKIQRIHK